LHKHLDKFGEVKRTTQQQYELPFDGKYRSIIA